MIDRCLQILSAILMLILAADHVHAQQNWPEYRGPTGDGQAVGAKLPSQLADENVKWKTAIHGKGWSSPVIWGNQVWVTTATEDGKTMSAICVDLDSGNVLQDLVIHENESPDFCHPTNSYASPTPAIEDGRVYLHFGSYGTTCLDTNTGKVIWQRTDLKCNHFRGPASSPIIYKDLLIVAFDGFDVQYVVALNKRTGETVWKTDRDIVYGTDNGDLKKAYGTGAIFEMEGEPLLVYPSAVATIAYQPETGRPVWTVYHDGMNASARPVQLGNGLVVITNGMGRMVAVDPKGTGNITGSNIAWKSSKSVAKKSSQIVIGNRLYMVSDKGVVSCLDGETGQPIWQERIKGAFASSPVYDGEKILAFSEDGTMYAFSTGDAFQLINKSQLGDGFKASPAVANGDLILRSFSHLYRVGN